MTNINDNSFQYDTFVLIELCRNFHCNLMIEF